MYNKSQSVFQLGGSFTAMADLPVNQGVAPNTTTAISLNRFSSGAPLTGESLLTVTTAGTYLVEGQLVIPGSEIILDLAAIELWLVYNGGDSSPLYQFGDVLRPPNSSDLLVIGPVTGMLSFNAGDTVKLMVSQSGIAPEMTIIGFAELDPPLPTMLKFTRIA